MSFSAARGPSVRELGLALPPQRMPLWRHGRPLKRWRYLGVYTPELMLCVGDARIGPVPRRWWAVAEPSGELLGRSSTRRAGVSLGARGVRVAADDARIDLALDAPEGVETATPVGSAGGYIWTRKRAGVAVRGRVVLRGREHWIEGPVGFSDESAGYHPRHTAWKWSAGLGRAEDGRRLAWNLASGIHDRPEASERTLWIDGEPRQLEPVEFAGDLSRVSGAEGVSLEFTEWAAREERMNLLLVRSSYRQPFGTFAGTLGDGIRLSEGYGVMEDHEVWW
ncbi:MAG: DUF2804 domain-containing protein [Actinomycetota bacterium]|nr:DUF2804 domain-containing protein [Actinomycetota bacterium]